MHRAGLYAQFKGTNLLVHLIYLSPALSSPFCTQSKVTLWRLLHFLCPLMLVLFIQRVSRPLINLMVARLSPTKAQAAEVCIHDYILLQVLGNISMQTYFCKSKLVTFTHVKIDVGKRSAHDVT